MQIEKKKKKKPSKQSAVELLFRQMRNMQILN